MNGAKYVSNSGNSKIAGSQKIDCTYASVKATCPLTCQFRMNGECYAQLGQTGMHVARIDHESEGLSVLQVARAEAQEIDRSYNGGAVPVGRNLRLHVSGDSRTIAGTRMINNALGRWKQRGGKIVWGYTHCWDHIIRDMWSNAEMLASVDSIDQVEYARQNGYAPSIVVAEHMSSKPYLLEGSDIKWIPCQAQVRGVGCCDCQICFKTGRLYHKNMGIAFAAHGCRKEAIKRRLALFR